MNYYIEISAKSGKKVTIDGRESEQVGNSFRKLSIKSDTPAKNVKSHASDILLKLKIELDINASTKDFCKDLLDWSLSTQGEDIYRSVIIKVYEEDAVIRTYEIPEMFVEDYKENYFKESENTDHGEAILKLLQKGGNIKSIKQLSE